MFQPEHLTQLVMSFNLYHLKQSQQLEDLSGRFIKVLCLFRRFSKTFRWLMFQPER